MKPLTPDTDDDDALAEALADAWVEQSRTDPFLRLAARQAAGLVPGTNGNIGYKLTGNIGYTTDSFWRLDG
jgi:hypothetical protein